MVKCDFSSSRRSEKLVFFRVLGGLFNLDGTFARY